MKRVWMPLFLAALATSGQAIVYDYTADFSITNGNPNGVWSYGAKRKDLDGKPTGEFVPFDATESSWYLEWHASNSEGNTFGGQTWKNVSGGSQYGIGNDRVSLNGDLYCTSTARWTAPGEGLIDIEISLGGSNSSRYLMIQGTMINDGMWYGYSAAAVPVLAGDIVDLTMYSAPHSGNTQTDFTITFTPVPEPAAMLVLALGVAGLARRRRT